jgi:hypothetical protein
LKHIKRTIEVFELGAVRVEVEGDTVSLQFAKPKNGNATVAFQQNPVTGVMGAILEMKTAMKLSEVLNSALAQSGEVVGDEDMVVYTVREPVTARS